MGKIKHLLTNNNYPKAIIDKAVNNFLQKKLATTKADENSIEPLAINLLFLNQISAQYKQDEKQLTQIIHRNIRAADNNGKVKLNFYYKNKKTQLICLLKIISITVQLILKTDIMLYTNTFANETDVRPLLLIAIG